VEKEDLKRFKEILIKEKEDVLRKAIKTLNEEAKVDVNELPDEIDLASSEYLQSLALRLRDREKSYLNKVELSLKKIERGEFGICENCGEEITLKRLEARPVTSLCIRCKEEQEKEERDYG
jgi:DnaK suppressor protein